MKRRHVAIAAPLPNEVRFLKALVSSVFSVRESELAATSRRSAGVAFARQVAMYLAHVAFGMRLSEVADAFGRDRSTAAHACRLVEDRREDGRFDYALDRLEAAARLWARTASARGALSHG